MLDYIIKVLIFQTLFLAVYDLILKRETFFQWNRAYLIGTSLIAYLIPLLKINKINEVIPQEYIVLLPEVLLSPSTIIAESFSWSTFLFTALTYLFWIGLFVASLLFVKRLFQVVRLIHRNEKEEQSAYYLVKLDGHNAFSFFNYIFLGKAILEDNRQQIILHELVHVRQKHSLDLLFFEIQKMICWFNPYSYMFQQRLSELHEFIADAKAIKEVEKKDYFQNLVAQTFGSQKISFINPFLKISLIKKRIVMLNKHKSKQFLKFKYLLMLPLLVGMLFYSSCENDIEPQQSLNKNEKRLITLFMKPLDGSEIKEIKTKKEGYFDMYMLDAKPNGKKISYNDLTVDEKIEFDNLVSNYDAKMGKGAYTYKIYEAINGKKSLEETIHWDVVKGSDTENEQYETEEVAFGKVINPPIFPGCEGAEDPKKCFNLEIQKYMAKNFDISLAKSLGLEAGKKKIYVQFLIDKEGNVIDAKSRAPHKALETEAINLVNGLPKMTPGKHKGKNVNVTYMLPISFRIE